MDDSSSTLECSCQLDDTTSRCCSVLIIPRNIFVSQRNTSYWTLSNLRLAYFPKTPLENAAFINVTKELLHAIPIYLYDIISLRVRIAEERMTLWKIGNTLKYWFHVYTFSGTQNMKIVCWKWHFLSKNEFEKIKFKKIFLSTKIEFDLIHWDAK